MDVNLVRIAVTVLSFGVFIGIVAWVWARRHAAGFDEASRLPFVEDAPNDARGPRP